MASILNRGENVEVGKAMLQHRGLNREASLLGCLYTANELNVSGEMSSLVWVIFSTPCSTRWNKMASWNRQHNRSILFALHISSPNHQLNLLVEAWNNHPVCTEGHWTPRKIWVNCMISHNNAQNTAVRDIFDDNSQPAELYGEDPTGPTSNEFDLGNV